MKIRSNPIHSDTTIAQQSPNTLKSPEIKKEVLADTKNQQLSGQLATSIKSEQSLSSMNRAIELHSSLAKAKITPALTEQIAQPEKLEHLRNQLDSLKNEKQGLVAQISTTTKGILAAELAHDDARVAVASAKLEELKSQLAKVDLEIKSILAGIEKFKKQEDAEQDRIKNQNDKENAVNSNLQKAADAYQQLLDATDLKP